MNYILLPAYNEERALGQLIPELAETLKPMGLPFRILVVDDGSRDGTPGVIQKWSPMIPIETLRHEVNRGYGAAIRTGILWVMKNGQPSDIVVTMDADTTHSPSYIPALVRKLDEGYGVVTTSYRMAGGESHGVPGKRRFLSAGANLLFQLRFRLPNVGTYTNGFRAYRLSALQNVYRRYQDRLIEQTNFAGGAELFIKTIRSGAKAGEIPFALHYERRGADSKIRIWNTIRGYLDVLKI